MASNDSVTVEVGKLRPKFPTFGPQVAIDELTVLYLHKGEADEGLMFVHHGIAVVDVN